MPEAKLDARNTMKTYGYLVAVEVKPIIQPSVVAELLKEYLERWGSKTDVAYLGEIDCYEKEKES